MPYAYEYLYPNDCLRAWKILPFVPQSVATNPPLTTAASGSPPMIGGPAVHFEMAQEKDANANAIRTILTGQPQAILVYTRATTDANLFDPTFVTALVGRLAAKLVIPCSGDKALAKIAIDQGLRAEADADAIDANEGLTTQNRNADWITARGAGVDWEEGGYYAGPGGVYGPSYPLP